MPADEPAVDAISTNVRLYGTDEEPADTHVLRAGPLTATLHEGALRGIAVGGREAIRGIAFIVRDENWGTCAPRITGLEINDDDGFRVRYAAECRNGDAPLTYRAEIIAARDGQLEFRVSATPGRDFLTSRTGFVVLHPVDGVAGRPVTVTHTDNTEELSAFPDTIKPSQPFFDIRTLAHDVADGCRVSCRMEGDAYEMEDQRNWTDASYKTYVRPLSKPHPYVLPAGRTFEQRVALQVEGAVSPPPARGEETILVALDDGAAGRVPEFGLAIHPDHLEPSRLVAGLVRQAGVDALFCTFDRSAGHDEETMAAYRRLSEATRTRLVLEAVLPLRDADGNETDDAAVLDADVEALRRYVERAGAEPAVVSVSPAAYLKSFQPGGAWPAVPPLDAVYAAVRRAFPKARVAGGMHSYFTELNRRRPPVEALDIVTHSTSPLVHAADDLSVMQTLQTLPWIFRSVRAIAPGKPYWIGPTAIGMRFNPYGASTAPNPDNGRTAMAEVDPRQRGLFNAAWTLGYIAKAAVGGVDGLCLSSAAGPFAIAWQPMPWHQPGFDELASPGSVFPVYHVIAGLARLAGAIVRRAEISDPGALAAVAVDAGSRRELWLANLTAKKLPVRVDGVGPEATVETLDEETFTDCCAAPDALARTAVVLRTDALRLNPYGVVRVTL